MTYLFFIQGEGRGHLTQALTLKEKLEARGHRVLAAVIGANPQTQLPAFFSENLNIPLLTVASPGFVVAKDGRGIRIGASILAALSRLPQYLKSLADIKKIIRNYQPDALVSFYEPMVGQYYRLYREARPLFCIGHQYFADSPVCQFPTGQYWNKLAFKLYNRFSAPRGSIRIALSFTAESDNQEKNLYICPPLIRSLVKKQEISDFNFLLIYLLNAGYSQDIIDWAKLHPDTKLEAFWNKPEQPITAIGDNLIFHHLSGQKFIDKLASCRAYISTAGFDSIAEAAYLQKNILMVPTRGHYEQQCNAVDAARAGIASAANHFDLSLINDQNKTHRSAGLEAFKRWVNEQDNKIVNLLERQV